MHNTLFVHVFDRVDQLAHKETASVFTHGTHFLANFEKYSTLYMLHDDVNQVLDLAPRWLVHQSLRSVVYYANDVSVAEAAQDFYLLLDAVNIFIGFEKVLFAEDLNCNCILRLANLVRQVNLGSLTVTKAGCDLVLVVEDWVLSLSFSWLLDGVGGTGIRHGLFLFLLLFCLHLISLI